MEIVDFFMSSNVYD